MEKRWLACLAVVVGLSLEATCEAREWTSVTVDAINDVGRHNDLALDAQNAPHISYQYLNWPEAILRYAVRDPATGIWATTDVDSDGQAGYYTSMVVNRAGHTHISSMNNNGVLRYATDAAGTWTSVSVDSSTQTNETALALDADDRPHIVYSALSYENQILHWRIKIAALSAGTWTTQTIADNDGGQYLALALGADHVPRMAYTALPGAGLKYACWNAAAAQWDIELIDGSSANMVSVALAVDNQNRPHVAYARNATLYYAVREQGVWQRQAVPGAFLSGAQRVKSLVLDEQGRPHIGYANNYATRNGTSWRIQEIDGAGAEAHLARDADGNIHVSSFQTSTADLIYSRGTPVELTPIANGDFESGEIAWDFGTLVEEGILLQRTDVIECPAAGGNHVARLTAFDYWDNGQCTVRLGQTMDVPAYSARLNFTAQFREANSILRVYLGADDVPLAAIAGPATPTGEFIGYEAIVPFGKLDAIATPLQFELEVTGTNAACTEGYSVYLDDVTLSSPGPLCGDSEHPYPTGDLSHNCEVNETDAMLFFAQWLALDCLDTFWCAGADLDQSGTVDLCDFAQLAAHWLESTAPIQIG